MQPREAVSFAQLATAAPTSEITMVARDASASFLSGGPAHPAVGAGDSVNNEAAASSAQLAPGSASMCPPDSPPDFGDSDEELLAAPSQVAHLVKGLVPTAAVARLLKEAPDTRSMPDVALYPDFLQPAVVKQACPAESAMKALKAREVESVRYRCVTEYFVIPEFASLMARVRGDVRNVARSSERYDYFTELGEFTSPQSFLFAGHAQKIATNHGCAEDVCVAAAIKPNARLRQIQEAAVKASRFDGAKV
jgi:hypothetical protein